MHRQLYESRGRFTAILFAFALIIIVALLLYTDKLVDNLRQEARSILQFYAQMYASAASDADVSDVSFIFDEIIKQTYFPIIYANDQQPIFWKGIGLDPQDRSPENLQKVTKVMDRLKKVSEPIPITHENMTLGYLYYGDSATITQLHYLPYIEIGLVGMFILLAFIGFSTIKKSEQRFIWVGMSKETAHQLGTPISALLGWTQLLRERSYNRPETIKVIDEMDHDVKRLEKVAQRFSQIGAMSDLQDRDIHKILKNVIEYIQRRLPQMNRTVSIEKHYGKIPAVPMNKDLIEWVLENLIKNAIDAIDHDHGHIKIVTGLSDRRGYKIYIDIIDNGRGISSKNKKEIFMPGYTTKKRGWGLGLNLAKRIVEEYHDGKLLILDSQIDTGTTMRMYL